MMSKHIYQFSSKKFISSQRLQTANRLLSLQQYNITSKSKLDEPSTKIKEDFQSLVRKLKVSEDTKEVSQLGNPEVVQQKDDVIYIENPKQDWKYYGMLKLNETGQNALTLALQKDQAIALLLKKDHSATQNATQIQDDQFKVKMNFGSVVNSLGDQSSQTQTANNSMEINISDTLKHAPYKRNPIKQQLFTGHLRLDLAQPLSQGNVILFKGERNSGKTSVAQNTIQMFLNENKNNKAVYVGLNKNSSTKVFNSIDQELQERLLCVTVGSDEKPVSDAEYFLAPKVALQYAQEYLQNQNDQEQKRLLFVFDDIIKHHFKEKYIFDLAQQPFAPFNICNEIMENTGIMKDSNYEMTSIFIVDTDSSSMMLKKDEQNFVNTLDSISDQIINFTNEENKIIRNQVPIIGLKNDNIIIDYWQTPYLRRIKHEMQKLVTKVNTASRQHTLRKELKIDEDPWDNYLVHDAKHFLPIICHQNILNIEEQVLLLKLINQQIKDETSSQFKIKNNQLIKELINFAKTFNEEEEDQPTILEQIRLQLDSTNEATDQDLQKLDEEVERTLKMFYLSMQVKGYLKPYKDDYFI